MKKINALIILFAISLALSCSNSNDLLGPLLTGPADSTHEGIDGSDTSSNAASGGTII